MERERQTESYKERESYYKELAGMIIEGLASPKSADNPADWNIRKELMLAVSLRSPSGRILCAQGEASLLFHSGLQQME